MDDILCSLKSLLESRKPPPETLPTIQKCLSVFANYEGDRSLEQLPVLLEELLISIIKPLFSSRATSSAYRARFVDDSKKPWKDCATWSVDILRWIVNQYGTLSPPLRKQAIDAQFSLFVPPILNLLDDQDLTLKQAGSDLLQILCNHIADCKSGVFKHTGLTKVFEDCLAPNMLLLPSLTPEKESLQILSSLYPAYRALVKASFLTSSSTPPSDPGKLIVLLPERTIASRQALDQHNKRQAMLDRVLRSGILAGYMHASENVKIATLLVSEMSDVVAMMGASSAKYLSTLLPLLRSILTNPLGIAHQPLLRCAAMAMQELILQCWPRIGEVWWQECLRAVVGLWLLLSEEDQSNTQELRDDAKGLIDLLLRIRGRLEARKELSLLEEEYENLKGLV
ncbi:hypothetical protein EPUS_02008 [Endocarpon pusillum Z07020]|uniref:Pre-rRNA-processing protein RIX1 n=1 Tax=Endocarpon pusillum (strain Z07020 / HMAS-L-300199) TaxID=1263415 RepID=U1GQR9_ENDPU|nr:uncharacterized protein EPUS_02008 [Endocarpon pusillum Z07020]ERF74321.1 hypothetical protein EPUS_02008 [Endocarpon pusillum Z07020]